MKVVGTDFQGAASILRTQRRFLGRSAAPFQVCSADLKGAAPTWRAQRRFEGFSADFRGTVPIRRAELRCAAAPIPKAPR